MQQILQKSFIFTSRGYKSLFLRLLNELYYLRFAQTQNSIQKLFCNFCFGHLLQLAHFAVRKQEFNDIGIRVKSCPLQSDIVSNDHIQILFADFFFCISNQILSFGGKATKNCFSLRSPRAFRISGFLSITTVKASSVFFLIFCSATSWGL